MASVKMKVDTPDVKEARIGGSSSLSESSYGSSPALSPPASGWRRSAKQAKRSRRACMSNEGSSSRATRRAASRNKAPKEEVQRPREIVVALAAAQTDFRTSKRKSATPSLGISKHPIRNQLKVSDKEANTSASGSVPVSVEANGSPSLPASVSVPQECDPNPKTGIVVETYAAEEAPAQEVGGNSITKTANISPSSERIQKEADSIATAQPSSSNEGEQKPKEARLDDEYAHLKLEDLVAEQQHILMQEILGEVPVAPLPVWECIDEAFLLAPPPFVLEPYIPPRRMHDLACPLNCFCTPITYMEC